MGRDYSANRRGFDRGPRKQFFPHVDRTYLAFYKPFEVLNQFSADGSEKTTLAAFGFPKDVYPVGRLDFDSEGLLILSNDGRLTTSLFDQDNPHARTYLVQVEREPSDESLKKLEEGLMIEGRRTMQTEAFVIDGEPELPRAFQTNSLSQDSTQLAGLKSLSLKAATARYAK
jgi:pseudouridine synthase